jgi:O-acetyl-ADP-ribose deacetylase
MSTPSNHSQTKRQLPFGCVELVLGNIVDQDTDAIVNAANTKLSGGGGVDGAIHRAAGPILMELCKQFPENERGQRCPTGSVKTTLAGSLRAKFVIHAVGPFYNEKYSEKAIEQLHDVYANALQAAIEQRCGSISFPAISTGAYRFPISIASRIAVNAACQFLSSPFGGMSAPEDLSPLQLLVRFVLFKPNHFEAFAEALMDGVKG